MLPQFFSQVDVVNGINHFEAIPTEVIFGINYLKEIKNQIKNSILRKFC